MNNLKGNHWSIPPQSYCKETPTSDEKKYRMTYLDHGHSLTTIVKGNSYYDAKLAAITYLSSKCDIIDVETANLTIVQVKE
jgi:hypothetical protein